MYEDNIDNVVVLILRNDALNTITTECLHVWSRWFSQYSGVVVPCPSGEFPVDEAHKPLSPQDWTNIQENDGTTY